MLTTFIFIQVIIMLIYLRKRSAFVLPCKSIGSGCIDLVCTQGKFVIVFYLGLVNIEEYYVN